MILVRYDEIGIKGQNRPDFENRLIDNIRLQARNNGAMLKSIKSRAGRILADAEEHDFLKRVFGVSSYSKAIIANTWEELVELVSKIQVVGSFRVSCQRIDKNFQKKSPEVEREIGAVVQHRTQSKVNLEAFDTEICIEIIDGKFFVFTERIRGLGGLPVGCEGAVYLKAGEHLELCALMLMKRGCRIFSGQKFDVACLFSPHQITDDTKDAICEARDSFFPENNGCLFPLVLVDANEREKRLNGFRLLAK